MSRYSKGEEQPWNAPQGGSSLGNATIFTNNKGKSDKPVTAAPPRYTETLESGCRHTLRTPNSDEV